MAAAVAVPEHKLSESPNSRAIDIFDWSVTAQTGPISSATRCDALYAVLGFPLPEMTFGTNLLQITHRPTGWTYAFRVEDALREVKNGPLEEGDGGVKVGYAEAWLKSRWVSYLTRCQLRCVAILNRTLPSSQDQCGLWDPHATNGDNKTL